MAPGASVRLARVVVVLPGHDAQHGRLAGAVVAEDADLGAREEGQGDVLEHRLVRREAPRQAVHGEDVLRAHRAGESRSHATTCRLEQAAAGISILTARTSVDAVAISLAGFNAVRRVRPVLAPRHLAVHRARLRGLGDGTLRGAEAPPAADSPRRSGTMAACTSRTKPVASPGSTATASASGRGGGTSARRSPTGDPHVYAFADVADALAVRCCSTRACRCRWCGAAVERLGGEHPLAVGLHVVDGRLAVERAGGLEDVFTEQRVLGLDGRLDPVALLRAGGWPSLMTGVPVDGRPGARGGRPVPARARGRRSKDALDDPDAAAVVGMRAADPRRRAAAASWPRSCAPAGATPSHVAEIGLEHATDAEVLAARRRARHHRRRCPGAVERARQRPRGGPPPRARDGPRRGGAT